MSKKRSGHVTLLSRDCFSQRPDGPTFSEFTQLVDGCISGPKPKQLVDDWHIAVVYWYRGKWYRSEFIFHAGLRHDGSSIPLFTAGLFRMDWRKAYKAGAGHDGLYQSGIVERGEADRIWRVIATHGDVWKLKPWQGQLGEKGLRLGGGIAWSRYRTQQQPGQ